MSGRKKWAIRPSTIHGVGVFAERRANKNEHVGVAIEGGSLAQLQLPGITRLGSLINHSYTPNARLQCSTARGQGGTYFLVPNRNVDAGVELTVDYRKNPWWVQGPETHYV